MSISMDELQRRVKFIDDIRIVIPDLDTRTPVSCFKIKDSKYIDYGIIQTDSLPKMYAEFRANYWVMKIHEQVTNVRAIVLCKDIVVIFFIEGCPVYINDPTFHRAMKTVFLRV